jgi:hypothetical protein
MGRPGVSKAEVVRAYVALKKQQRAPTLLNLRLELGRGSYSTIGAHLASLKLVCRPKAVRPAGSVHVPLDKRAKVLVRRL